MAKQSQSLCPDDQLTRLLNLLRGNESGAMRELEILLGDFPKDPRLHFLRGSLLAGRQDYAAARACMRLAVDLAPDYHVARFQLGFLLLTSGEPHAAQEAWGPLHALHKENHLRLFVEGLCHLIRDEFAQTIECLEKGIACNLENPPMNHDMQLIIDKARGRRGGEDASAASSVDLLLQQSLFKTRH